MMQQTYGYAHKDYIFSLEEFGKPLFLPKSGGWILRRPVSESAFYDGMGGYPLFSCLQWENLAHDFKTLEHELVSLVLISDVFGAYTEQALKSVFNDLVLPFKTHFIVDLSKPLNDFILAHHRYYGRKAQKEMDIFPATDPQAWLNDWQILYNQLIERYKITGMSTFSPGAFQKQFRVPGLQVFIARSDDQVLGMQMWFVSDVKAYHHLSAYSKKGYQKRASYGLLWFALNYFQDKGLKYLDLGGVAGLNNKNDGLSKFKAGWSNEQRWVYLCGKIFDKKKYSELAAQNNSSESTYFPSYREGEFA